MQRSAAPSPSDPPAPARVAIIGGGCAALAAAFELSRPELEGRFSVTVYQMGWRLGGKGASGRGVSDRIEEHGLHLWMGYYENAFRLLRECYAELQRSAAAEFPWRFEDAFSPANLNGAMDWSPVKGWVPWKVRFPAMPGIPGDPDPPRFSITDYLVHAAELLRTLLSTLPVQGPKAAQPFPDLKPSIPAPEQLGAALERLVKYAAAAGLTAAIEGLSWLEVLLQQLALSAQSQIVALIDMVTEVARRELAALSRGDDEVRRLLEVAELILATIRGAIRFRLVTDPRGFDAIDDYDCREWLRLNGASQQAIDSAFIRALYDLAFAFEGGDTDRPAIAAGSAIRGAFRAFFSYRGAFFWKMNAGMGDVVFSPLYLLLRKRGVRFEFFHKLTAVHVTPAGDAEPHVTGLDFDVQARTTSGQTYEPLCTVKGVPCWPARPRYDQLVAGDALEAAGVDLESQWDRRLSEPKQLRVGQDFDLVVLGVGLGVVPMVCAALVEQNERWRAMVERVRSVPTQAFQLWLDRSAEELHGDEEAINLSGFVEPFDTWADLTHLGPVEGWEAPPRSIAYFCNVLPTPPENAGDGADPHGTRFVQRAKAEVERHCVDFLSGDVRHLWPRSHAEGTFCWSALVSAPSDAAGRASGPARFRTQYWTANVRPSDRYSQSLPGTTRYRISPLDRTYDNLSVAGDWTSCGINMGCVEAAVMSGLLAAHAISGFPAIDRIIGYDHP